MAAAASAGAQAERSQEPVPGAPVAPPAPDEQLIRRRMLENLDIEVFISEEFNAAGLSTLATRARDKYSAWRARNRDRLIDGSLVIVDVSESDTLRHVTWNGGNYFYRSVTITVKYRGEALPAPER